MTNWVDFTVQTNGLPNPNERLRFLVFCHDKIKKHFLLCSFKMNGRGLSLMTMEMFSSRVPCGGKTLFKESAF